MGRPTNAEREARLAAANAESQQIEAEEYGREMEPFERPVPKVTAETTVPEGKVKVRVLPKGDGKVATGHYDRQTNSFTAYKRGDFLMLHPSIAKTQEDNGLVEIVTEE